MTIREIAKYSIALAFVCFMGMSSFADDETGVPASEQAIAINLGVSGPTESHGIESAVVLELVDLEDDFAALEGHSLRARKVAIAPGGVVGVHRHTSRPGILYVLDGEMTEFRNDQDGGVTRYEGDTTFEKEGVIHWWRNDSEEVATALAVDIVSDESL